MNIFQEAKQILDKDGKVNPLGPYGKQKLTGREISTYFRRNKVNDATIKKAVEVALDLGGADTIARQEIKKFYGDKVLKSKEVQQALKYANESFTYNQSLNQISEENLVEKNLMPDIQKIVDTKGAKKVGGIMVDMFTASMINQIYNKVNDQNKKKMEKSNISTLVDIAQRMMQKMGDNLGEGKGTDVFKKYNKLIGRLSDNEQEEVLDALYTMNTQSGSRYKEAWGKVKELLNMGDNLGEGAFSVKLNKPYKRGDEKMYMDIIKKYGGKNLKVSPPKGRDLELDITFDGGDVKKIKSNLPNKGKGSEWISEAANPAQQAAIAISKKEKGEKPIDENLAIASMLGLAASLLPFIYLSAKELAGPSIEKLVDKLKKNKNYKMSNSEKSDVKGFLSKVKKEKPSEYKKAEVKAKSMKEDAVAKAKLTLKHTQDMQKLKDKQAREKEAMSESDMQNVDDAPKDKWKALGFSQHPHKGFEDERLPKDMRDFRKKAKTPSQMRVEDAYRQMWEDGQKYAPELVEVSQKAQIRKAIDIASSMGGNMTDAVKRIEAIKKGLSKHKNVRKALQLANEEMVVEVTDKEINAMKQLSKDAEKIKKNYQKIVNMGDKELKDRKYNKEYEDILQMSQSVLSLIGKLQTQKIINKESLEEKLSKADLKMIDMMYDKKGKLTDVGKAVMNYKPGDNIRKIVQNLNNKN